MAEQLQKCGEREGTRAAAFRCLRPGQLQKQQGEEQQLPNSPTRGGRGGAWVPVEARGAVWTVVSRERRKQERERSGAQSSEHQLQHPVRGCRCVGDLKLLQDGSPWTLLFAGSTKYDCRGHFP